MMKKNEATKNAKKRKKKKKKRRRIRGIMRRRKRRIVLIAHSILMRLKAIVSGRVGVGRASEKLFRLI